LGTGTFPWTMASGPRNLLTGNHVG